MKTVYFKSGEAEWKYELDDEEFQNVINNILEDGTDFEEMLDDSLEIIRDTSSLDEDEMDEDDEIDQTISVAFIWRSAWRSWWPLWIAWFQNSSACPVLISLARRSSERARDT